MDVSEFGIVNPQQLAPELGSVVFTARYYGNKLPYDAAPNIFSTQVAHTHTCPVGLFLAIQEVRTPTRLSESES